MTRWRKLYVVAVLGWTLSAILALVLLGSFPYELFFVLSVIGFLTVMVLAHRFT